MSSAGRSLALTIREARPGDAEPMLALVHALAAETDVDVPLEPGEFTITVEQERSLLREYADRENAAFFTAWRGEELLGMLNLDASRLHSGRHRAMLGMSVARASRGQGVGRALLEHAVDWARQTRLLTRIELDVYVRNAPARHLYESVGFEEEVQRRAPVWEGETPVDSILMGLCFDDKAPVAYRQDPPEADDAGAVREHVPVTIRDATAEDAEGLMALWRAQRSDPALLTPTAGLPWKERPEAFRERLQSTLDAENGHVLVAEAEGRVVGTVEGRGHQRRRMCREALVAIGVAAPWRGRGIGRRLLAALEKRARDGGIIRRLMLWVYAENEPALGLYRSCGYEVEGRIRNAWFQRGRYHDELMLAKLLD
ncbi:MAG: GNAT family N-acetyltransferase [Planctomycetota bacterium]|nr:GNAT family N-acetyltransferase [Planctomycetota bacterium]